MKVQSVTVMQRKNMGNFEHLEITLNAQLNEDRDTLYQINELKSLTHNALNSKVEALETEKKEDEYKEEVVADVKGTPKVTKPKKPATKKVEVVEEEVEEIQEVDPNQVDMLAEVEVDEEPKKVAKKEKLITYDRMNEGHKGKLSSYLNSNHPSWKSFSNEAEKQKVIAFTTSLQGKDFLNSNGEIVESFKGILSDFFA